MNEVNSADTESASTDQANISADNSQSADAFSSGDFSDGVSADGDIGDSGNAQTQDDAGTGTDSAFDAGTDQDAGADSAQTDTEQTASEIVNDEINPLIPYTQTTTQAATGEVTSVDKSVGKSSNPKVYYGKTIDQYPYYQYTLISDMKKVVACADANQEAVNNGTYQSTPAATPEEREKNITFQDGQYWYWTVNADGTFERNPISVVTQRQPVSYDDIRKLPENLGYNYYYRVKQAYFCCSQATGSDNDHAYTYYGWYSPSYADQNNVYIKVVDGDGKVATHYISDAEYKLTPGIGNYDFVPDDTKGEATVEVNHMYYQGGYKNNDWFKKYVFHIDPNDEETAGKFKIQVDTKTVAEFEQMCGNNVLTASEENMDAAGIEDGITTDTDTDENGIVNSDDDENNMQGDQTADAALDEIQNSDSTQEETSEVTSMVSEAGVELVSIESEFSDDQKDTFQDDTTVSGDATTETPQTNTTDEIVSADAVPEISDSDSGNVETFSAGDTGSAETELSKYDLIYINGVISENSLNAIGTIPLIINEPKVESSTDLQNVLKNYMKDTDTDKHYVNKYIYFFNNTLQEGQTASLVNTAFHTAFNSSDDITDGSSTEGFEEILDYIETENKFRSLGETSDGDYGDGESIEPLDTDISQARAIEYIINYKYKRSTNSRTNFNVLEIEPAKSDGKVAETDVLNWLNNGKTDADLIDTDNVKVCCYHNGDGNPENMFDSSDSSIWHSAYDIKLWEPSNPGNNTFDDSVDKNQLYDHAQTSKESKHWIEIPLNYSVNVDGFWYQARPQNGGDGTKNGVLDKYTMILYDADDVEIDRVSGSSGLDGNNISQSRVRISFGRTIKNVKKIKLVFDSTFGSAGNENKFASCAGFGLINASVTNMTAAEFVGHIDDIASEYDMIYIGDDSTNRNKWLNGADSTMLYAHVGGAVSVSSDVTTWSKLLGQLDNEYDQNWSGDAKYKKRFAPTDTYSENGAGYFRGSGNDMTKQECQELINYVKSGYPVVLGNTLVSGEGTERKVNKNTVDASSYYYQFLKEAIKYENVVTRSEVEQEGKVNEFFAAVTKPMIQFADNGRPPEPARMNENISGTGAIDQELKYVFTIENDSDATPAVSTYNCKLYIDLNFDGNMSEKESQDKYITITDSKGNVMIRVSYGENDQRYELKLGEQYTVTRKIPVQYYKLITWKLEISNNSNPYVHTSETGYAKQNNNTGNRQTIKVLQIGPDTGEKWNLSKDTTLDNELNGLQDFEIKIDYTTISELSATNSAIDIWSYQILIIGFNDVYQDIPQAQVEEIKKYIQSGRSVIFSHDTTSYLSYEYGWNKTESIRYSDVYPKIAKTQYEGNGTYYDVFFDDYLNGKNKNAPDVYNPSWGISMNNILRSIVGMDRYGITQSEKNVSGKTISSLLKEGHPLDSKTVDFNDLIKYAGDIAYITGDESRSTSYAQTQAFSNGLFVTNTELGQNGKTSRATKVNDGAITQYPYRIADTISVGETHGQYYQLALEQDMDINGKSDGKTDIVVWYCLSDSIYAASPNDARNYYYYYSKGNVIYTGTGHSGITGDKKITDTERHLFINSIVAAANVTATEPDVTFVKSLNPAAEKETTRYYTTDQATWTGEDNTLEKNMELYFNVRDYNMVSADLNQKDLDKQEMTVQIYIESPDGNELTATDLPASITGKKLKDITANVLQLKEYNGTEKSKTVDIGSDNKFHLKQNNAYSFEISGIEAYLRDTQNIGSYKNKKVYVLVTSTVYLYGNEVSTSSAAVLDLKQRQLFDLD